MKKNKNSDTGKQSKEASDISPAKAQSDSAKLNPKKRSKDAKHPLDSKHPMNAEKNELIQAGKKNSSQKTDSISLSEITDTNAIELNLESKTVEIENESKIEKKQIKPAFLISILALLTFVVIIGIILVRTNMPERLSIPLTVKNEDIYNPEFSFMYHYILRQNGIDIYREGEKIDDILSAPGENNFPTQRDYFLDFTAQTIQVRNFLYDDAISKGFKISDADRKLAETYIDWIDGRAKELGVNRDVFIRAYFGKNVSENLIRDILTKQYFTENYEKGAKLTEMKATQEQAESIYQSARDQYDEISYHSLRIVYEETGQSFIDTAMKNAGKIVENIKRDPTKFQEVAAEYFVGDEKEKLLVKDSTLSSNVRYLEIENEEWRDWLFDPERETGDCRIFTDLQGFPIIFCFVERQRQTEPLREADIIMIYHEDSEAGVPGIPETDITAFSQHIFDAISNREAIANLTTAYSDEVLDRKMEFIYNDMIHPGEYEPEVNDWIFDPLREKGEKTILTLDRKMVLIYYSGASENPEWFDMVNSFIRMENYNVFLNEKKVEYPYVLHKNVLKYITDVPEVIAQQMNK